MRMRMRMRMQLQVRVRLCRPECHSFGLVVVFPRIPFNVPHNVPSPDLLARTT
jgi:hypothetical protein